jgi:hypothetical protein
MTAACTTELANLLPAFALDAVDDVERDAVREHVAGCLPCSIELAQLRAAAKAIDEEQPAPSPKVWQRILGDVRARRPKPAAMAEAGEPGTPSKPVTTRVKARVDAVTAADIDVLRLTSKAAHELLWIDTAEEAAAIVGDFVRTLGGAVVSHGANDPDCIPIDISFGSGTPVFPASPQLSMARMLLEESLPAVVEDARRAIALARERRRHNS